MIIFKKAFTLAEILIVLVIIGILTMILLPIAFQSSPNEDVMKFKKGYNTLGSVIRELVTSDKYYQNGDLGIDSKGNQIYDGEGQRTYFCKSFADVISAKEVNCMEDEIGWKAGRTYILLNGESIGASYKPKNPTQDSISQAKIKLDTNCKDAQNDTPEEIILNDGIIFYSASSVAFGTAFTKNANDDNYNWKTRYFSPPDKFPANYCDKSGFDIAYKVFCMDVDKFNSGEDPFGFGIRADGKILTGARADEWVNKSIQKE